MYLVWKVCLCLLNNTHTAVLNVGLGLDWIGMTEACLHLSVLHLLHVTGVYPRVLCKIRAQCLDLATHNLSLLVTFNCTWVMGGGGFIFISNYAYRSIDLLLVTLFTMDFLLFLNNPLRLLPLPILIIATSGG